MNLLTLILILIFSCQESHSQNKEKAENKKEDWEVKENINECEKGKTDAEKDFRNDDLGLYFYGLPSPRFNTWVRLMREEYNLKVKGGGDIIDEEGDCYNQVMEGKIKDKFGEDAFDRIEIKLDSIYEIGLGDREPEFEGGDSEFLKYIYCNLGDELLSGNTEEVPIIVIQISISEEGKVENEGIVFKNNFAKVEGKYEKKVIELIENMPDWIPAIENKKKIKYRFNLPIKFGKKMKEKNCG